MTHGHKPSCISDAPGRPESHSPGANAGELHRVAVCLGSNVARKREILEEAVGELDRLCTIECRGIAVESDDVTGRGAPYINMAIVCRTHMGIEEFGAMLHSLEIRAGRTATSKSEGIMPLDADIVLWDGAVVNTRNYEADFFRLSLKTCSGALSCP